MGGILCGIYMSIEDESKECSDFEVGNWKLEEVVVGEYVCVCFLFPLVVLVFSWWWWWWCMFCCCWGGSDKQSG